MRNSENCESCGKPIQDSRKQKAERGMIMRSLKLIKIAGIQELEDATKKECFDCWKLKARKHMKPFAQALGESAEDW